MKLTLKNSILSAVAVAASAGLLALLLRPSLKSYYISRAESEFSQRQVPPGVPLKREDLQRLPKPVRRYIELSGALGKPRPLRMRAEFDAIMRAKPGAAPMPAHSEQHNFFDQLTRLFYMKSRMFGLPVRVVHAYGINGASMLVRIAGLFNAVNIQGPELFKTETVTLLNDICLLAPGALIDPRLSWRAIDPQSSEVTFKNQDVTVKALLFFNAKGELINFVSDDRGALGSDGVLRLYRFSTPVSDYQNFNGMRLALKGDAIWHYPEGDFTYGSFTLKKIDYNLPVFKAP